MRWFWKPWSYQRAMWGAALAGFVVAAMFLAVGWAAGVTRGFTMLVGFALVFGPVLIGQIVRAPAMDRENKHLIARGYSEADARKRIGRNALWFNGPLILAVGVWASLIWLVAILAAPASAIMSDLRMFGGIGAFQLAAAGAITCWMAWRMGRIVGHGQHCGKCGYAVAATGVPLCPECGRVFVFSKDTSDGRVERPSWMLPLAVASTLAVVSVVAVKGWRGFADIGMGVAPTSALISVATGSDDRLAMSAWGEIPTRNLDDAARQKLMDGILTRWETDGSLPYLHAKKMTGFIHDELIARAVDEATLDRLVALAPSMPADLYGRNLIEPLRRSALTASQLELMVAAAWPTPGAWEWVNGEGTDWLAERFAAGEFSAEQEQAYLAELRAAARDERAYRAIGAAGRIAETTTEPRIYNAMMEVLLESIATKTGGSATYRLRDLFRRALVDRRLTVEQSAALFVRAGEASLFDKAYWLTLTPEEQARMRDLFVDLVAVAPTKFAQHRSMWWRWLLTERREDRLSPDQSALIDAAAAAIKAEANRIEAPR